MTIPPKRSTGTNVLRPELRAHVHRFPCTETAFIDLVDDTPLLFTIEESFLPGSLGSYILEILSDNGLKKDVKRFGVTNGWVYRYGGREDNRAYHGIDERTLISDIGAIVKNGA